VLESKVHATGYWVRRDFVLFEFISAAESECAGNFGQYLKWSNWNSNEFE
jgi:hypothetical protein